MLKCKECVWDWIENQSLLHREKLRINISTQLYVVSTKNCSDYYGISLLSTSYKILSNILLSRLSPYIDEIIGDH
jgi:hypothetical protein